MQGKMCVHNLGTGKLSRLRPQGRLPILHQPRSRPCGFVPNLNPQPVDNLLLHSRSLRLSTVGPQKVPSCPQLCPGSPQGCPLFGNPTLTFTVESERRHTPVVDWAVGNVGKAGDGPGEKYPLPVHRVCRTFGCPQRHQVVHRFHPQGRWTKNRF
ncbi:hypothetical protein CP967_17035 [Streptomyces nitrosporeus]|uniref:Uncharacterized protein n=1 Tax=Streptomyces nitrosporeus TaxID=28894 RepID=A0A5J6FIX7_9ACTN|nr:hypothetical protein CP967_17035 [Streptomyces nitrosporeus]